MIDSFRSLSLLDLASAGNKEDHAGSNLLLVLLILVFALPKSDESLVSKFLGRIRNKTLSFILEKSDERLTWTLYRKGYLSHTIHIL